AIMGALPYKTLTRVIETAHGELKTEIGLTQYAARPISQVPMSPMVVAFVHVPSAAEGAPDLVSSLVALTTLFVVVAAVFAYLIARDSEVDVDLLAGRVRAMVHVTSEPSGESVPLRTFDEVG